MYRETLPAEENLQLSDSVDDRALEGIQSRINDCIILTALNSEDPLDIDQLTNRCTEGTTMIAVRTIISRLKKCGILDPESGGRGKGRAPYWLSACGEEIATIIETGEMKKYLQDRQMRLVGKHLGSYKEIMEKTEFKIIFNDEECCRVMKYLMNGNGIRQTTILKECRISNISRVIKKLESHNLVVVVPRKGIFLTGRGLHFSKYLFRKQNGAKTEDMEPVENQE